MPASIPLTYDCSPSHHTDSVPSRARVTEQVLSRPFFPSGSQDRHLVQRVADMIFDNLGPAMLPAQRKQFVSRIAPFLIVATSFVANANVDSPWQSTALLSTICALIVHVLFLQATRPAQPGFDGENAIFLVGFFRERITVPYQFCQSFEVSAILRVLL